MIQVARDQERVDDQLDPAFRKDAAVEQRREGARPRSNEVRDRELLRRETEPRRITLFVELQRGGPEAR